MVQLAGTYGFTSDPFIEGQKADLTWDYVDSYAASEAIAPGQAVVQGDSDNVCDLPDTAGDTFLGIALHTHTLVQGFNRSAGIEDPASSGATYVAGDAVSVLSLGRCVMMIDGEFDKNDPLYIIVDDQDANYGKGTADDDGTLGPVGKILSSGEDQLAWVEITASLRGPQGEQGEPGV